MTSEAERQLIDEFDRRVGEAVAGASGGGAAPGGPAPGGRDDADDDTAPLRREINSLRAALEGATLRAARLSAELDAARRPPSHAVIRPGGRFDLFDDSTAAGRFECRVLTAGWHAELVAVTEWTRHAGAGPAREALEALALRRPPRFREAAGEATS